MNNSECGAIKGADTLLGHPLYATDSDTVIRYLDVNIERKRKLKTFNEIKKLEPESNDIFCDSFVDTYYPQRPVELESKSLYEFAQWYMIFGKRNQFIKQNFSRCLMVTIVKEERNLTL